MLKKILLLSGLKEMADYKFVSGYVNRFEEMQKHKEYAAGMLGLHAGQGRRATGIRQSRLERKADWTAADRAATFVRRQWASEHADLLVRYIAATIEANGGSCRRPTRRR